MDILTGRVFRDRLADDGSLIPVAAYDLPGTVGAITPIHDDDGWLLATGPGFAYLSVDGSRRMLAEVCPDAARMNDAACDPQGRFWAGTVADDHHPGRQLGQHRLQERPLGRPVPLLQLQGGVLFPQFGVQPVDLPGATAPLPGRGRQQVLHRGDHPDGRQQFERPVR